MDNLTAGFEWSDDILETAERMWAKHESAAAIGKAIGCSRNAVIGKFHRLGITRTKLPPGEALARSRARDAAKKARRRAKRKQDAKEARINVPANVSKTHPTYRRRICGLAPVQTKSELLAILRQAVLNTQGAM